MQNTDGAAEDVSPELSDLRNVPLHEMPAGLPVALDRAVRRVLPAPVEAAAVVHSAAFSACI